MANSFFKLRKIEHDKKLRELKKENDVCCGGKETPKKAKKTKKE